MDVINFYLCTYFYGVGRKKVDMLKILVINYNLREGKGECLKNLI